MNLEERIALFKKLFSPKVKHSKPQAREALRMLKSLENNPPYSYDGERDHIIVDNKEAGIFARAIETQDGKTDVSFKTSDTYYDRPGKSRSAVQKAAFKAVMGQLLDNIPSTREIARGDVKNNILPDIPSQIALEAIFDNKDAQRQGQRGVPVNQRASLYTKATKGAIKPYPPNDFSYGLDWPGYTEKIGPTTWQPKDSKGRYMKYVQWDPRTTLDTLKAYAKAGTFSPYAPLQTFSRGADALLTADSIVEGITGVSPTREVIKGTVKTLADMYRTKPTTNIGPILPY